MKWKLLSPSGEKIDEVEGQYITRDGLAWMKFAATLKKAVIHLKREGYEVRCVKTKAEKLPPHKNTRKDYIKKQN